MKIKLYIGKGSKSRARDFANRSNIYKRYIESIGKENIKAYIIEESYDEELIINLETLAHDIILSKGYKLFSKPKDGTYGCLKGKVTSDETKIKISKSKKGKTHTEESIVNELNNKGMKIIK